VSNYSTDRITEFAAVLPAETVQPPYHLFRRDIEADLLPYARAHHIGVLACGPLARGLLGSTITEATTFGPGDWRSHSPAFTGPGFGRNLEVVAAPGRFAADRGATIAQLAVAWALAHPAVQVAIVGSCTPAHLEESLGALDLTLSQRRPRRNRLHHGRRGTAWRPLSGRYDVTTIQPLRAARQSGEQQCPHRPPCPRALAHDRSGARIRASHPEQCWSLLCNGVVIFDDGGALLPGGRAILPPPARARMVAPAA
jgi:diketogulonate reductase-like aldo/keto reductase